MIRVCHVDEVPLDTGVAVLIGEEQLALFRIGPSERWFALENSCPHLGQMVLARGLIAEKEGRFYVCCPLHKNAFDLESGAHADGRWCLRTYPVTIIRGEVYVAYDAARGDAESEPGFRRVSLAAPL